MMTLERSLIIPLYRSEEGIPHLFEALEKMQEEKGFEVVFVDDGSPDHSREMLLKMLPGVKWPWKFVSHARNFGSFEAIRTGFANAS